MVARADDADIVARAVLAEELSGTVDETTGELLDLNRKEIVANSRPAVCDLAAAAHLFDAIRRCWAGANMVSRADDERR